MKSSAPAAPNPRTVGLVEVLAAACFSAAVVAIASAFRARRGALAVLALGLPPALVLALVARATERFVRPRFRDGTAASIAMLGFAFANVGFAASPRSATTASVALVACGLALALRRALHDVPEWREAALLLPLVVLLGLDFGIFPRHLATGHALASLLAGFVAALLGLTLARRRPVALLFLGALAAARLDEPALRAMADEPAVALPLLRAYRRAFDRDGDGFSAALGGGDCDDGDPQAYPLSLTRDCLRFVPDVVPPLPPAAVDTPWIRGPRAPRRIVLLTIDALRCSLTDDARFADACPRLHALAHRAVSQRRAHAAAPSSRPSLHAMLTGRLHRSGHRSTATPYFPERMRAAGYRTIAVLGHTVLTELPGLDRAFDVVDASLAGEGARLDATPDEALLDRTRGAVGAARGPSFAWVHLLGPHAPYVRREGDRFVLFRDAGYRAELLRTDALAAAFVQELLADGPQGDTVIVLSADHGEAFGEHGSFRHAMTLFDVELRIPFVLLGLPPDARVEAPTSALEVPALVRALVEGGRFAPARGHAARYYQAAAYIEGRHKLLVELDAARVSLFDLDADPGELDDLSGRHPALVRALGTRLGGVLASMPE